MKRTLILAAPLLLLAACGGSQENALAAIDNEIAKADIDPAIASAIEDEIMVDPALVGQNNPNAVRQPERPLQAPYPARASADGAQANGQSGDVGSPCGMPFQFGAEWAEKLPAEFPAYPGGRVTEAAGSDRGNCHSRVVTFSTDHGWEQVFEFYRGAAQRAGYDVEQEQKDGDQILGGTRGDAAYLVIVSREGNGSKVALIVSSGRS